MILVLSIILFTQFSTPYETKVFLDADGNFLIYARYYQDELIGIDSIKSVSEHLDEGISAHNREMLLQELKRDLVQQGGYASQGLFGTFEVPLPKGGFSEFMGETGKLDVGGHVKITLGGSETFISNLPGESGPSLLPELEMKQEMAINLDGQVGDRMRVFIDHNSERINETQNKITVTYKGREDEIIQEIEGGDTQLSIPATTYTGDIPSHQGLFGIKSTTKFGPLDVVAIASKEQTQTQEIEIEGSVRADTTTVWAKYYERRRFFWLGTDPLDEIIDLEIYVDDNNAQNNNQGITYFAEAYLDTNDDNVPDDTLNPTNFHEGYFTLKREGYNEYYSFLPGENMIELNYGLPTYYVLGVWYKKVTPNGDTVEVGRLYENDTIPLDTVQLKLICPRQLDTLSFTWHYERKNYYQIVSPGSRLDSLRIYYVTSGGQHKDRQDNVPYIQLLGLDQNKDGMIDENTVYFSGSGLLRFPDNEPFADSSVLDNPDPEIYRNPYMPGQGDYYIYAKTLESKPVYQLPENVIDVKVYVDDVLQDSTRDYHVDYEEGKLEFRKPIMPTQKIRIKIEYAPFFSAAEKSLLGLRGSLRPFGDANIGSSFFYRTESYPAEHVRLREEPFNRMVWEVDFAYPQELPFMTEFVDWLPLVETETESKMNVNFEGAYSFSNLNSKGEVYLDDLESSTIISNDVSITKTSWVLCSQPLGTDTLDFATQRLIWFNPRDEDRLQAEDIYVDPLDANEIADVLKVVFNPDDTLSFAGLTQYVYGEDFEEIENLELIIKGKGGRVHVDFAQEINEDQLRRNKDGEFTGFGSLNDEDRDRNGVWAQQDEDTGLDGVYGGDGDNIENDDGNDDYQSNDYTGGINGTELNRLWDTEDIDRNGVLNSVNRYHSYSIDLDSIEHLVQEAGLVTGWKMFRIPIKDSLSSAWDTVVGQPDWHDIKYVRIWFDNFASAETLLVYKLSATGSRWKNYGIAGRKQPPAPSEKFTLTPVNTKTHSAYYRSPYPVETDEFGQIKTEGGLEFRLENILEGHSCIAHRNTDDNEDYRAYDTLTFYLNAHNSNPLISVRIGSDTSNYYDYTTEYDNGILGYNNYRLFRVSMQKFLDLKKEMIDQNDTTISDSIYTVVGNPSLSKNQFFEVRITNQFVTSLTDTIWFNDVKLVSPKQDIGRILRSNGTISFADLASLSFAYDESNGRFKRLSESKEISTNSAGRGYSLSSTVSLNKFLPADWSFNIPFGLNYRKTVQEPRFSYFADDIEITEEEREKQKSITILKSYTFHVSKSNSRNWFLKNTVDRLSFDHDRSESYSKSITAADTSDIKNYRGSYTLDPKLDFKVFNQTFSPLPKNVNLSALYTDNSVRSYYRSNPDSAFGSPDIQRRKTLNPSFSVTYQPHIILNATYNISQSRDSVLSRRRFGEEVGRNQTFNASLARDLSIISPRLSFNSSYNEDYRFEIRQDQNLRNVSNSGRYGIEGQVNVKGIVHFFTRMRDETKDSLLVAGSPAWVAKQVEEFVSYLQNPSLNYSRQRSSNYLNVMVRPDVEYQWGIVDSIPPGDVAPGSYPGRGLTDTYGITSGVNYKVVNVNAGYRGTINRTFSYGGDEVMTKSRSYPNLTLRIMRLESLPLLKTYARSSSVTTGFSQSIEERYEVSADSTDLISDSKGINFSPLASWQANWKKGISTTTEITYSETNSNDYAGHIVLPSKMLNRGGSATVAYTFSAPKGLSLPFLQGVKFASNLSLNLSVTYNRSTSYFSDLTKPTSDTSTLSSILGLSYNFSSSITGGANFDYTQNNDMNSDQDSRRIGVNVWTNINF